jgi:acyl-CoA synthetase (AMP-forming)/AMP-acid ligase II/MFS family permease
MNTGTTLSPEQIRRSRRGTLFSMGLTYSLGTFNDNFFKQAALLLAASAGLHQVQGQATILFSLPFVLFSAWTGWLADRIPKRRIVIWAKVFECIAMSAAILSLVRLSWTGMLAVVFLMGLQSAIFSPALNGTIPEIFPAFEVPGVNSLLKTATTLSILLGIALAGIILDIPLPAFFRGLEANGSYGFGRVAVGIFAVFVSAIGLAAAFGVRKTVPAEGARAPFPLWGPLDSLRHALECRERDPSLFTTLMGEAFFYCLSSFAVLCITNLGVRQLHFSMTRTSLLSVALMVGICLGATAAGRLGPDSWRRTTVPAGVGMGASLILAGGVSFLPEILTLPWLLFFFTCSGIAGGVYLIPLISYIQIRPGEREKGKVQGISNFSCFSGIILSGLVLDFAGTLPPALLLSGCGVVALAFMLWTGRRTGRLPDSEKRKETSLAPAGESIPGRLLRAALSLRYRVTVSGLDAISTGGPLLIMPNHPALVDPLIVYSRLAGISPRPLSDARRMGDPLGRIAARLLRAILIPDLRKDGAKARKGVEEGLREVVQALKNKDSVLFYPAGRIYRSAREHLGGNSGAAVILRDVPDLRVVLVRTSGLWGSSFSYAGKGNSPDFPRTLLRGMATLLANGIFFAPRREVRVEFVEAFDLPRDGNKRLLNARLEEFYNRTAEAATGVPRFFWQGKNSYPLPEYAESGRSQVTGAAKAPPEYPAQTPDETRRLVHDALRDAAGLARGHVLTDDMTLGGDLGLDSLALMEFGLFWEREHGQSINNLESLVTVGDCLLAASGALSAPENRMPPPDAWFSPARCRELQAPASGGTITQAFVSLVRESPGQALLADRAGVKTRRDVLTAALILAERLRRLPGVRLGILLPASPTAVIVWLAALLAGKEPALFNWTVGEANMRHCLRTAGITHMVSAAALLDRLERQGQAPRNLPLSFFLLEEIVSSLSLREKALGALKARCLRNFRGRSVPSTAAILFTSGSEALPKAVPLTHANLLANAKDVLEVLRLKADDSVLAMLPPFHSFGLLVGLVLPLSIGLRAAFHPNPTESGPIVRLARDFRLTLLASPPTFLEAMLERAEGTTDLSSLRWAFVGAEKCPDHVYRSFAALCPDAALCEGYGITECSPVVSVNRPDNVAPGSIGHALPSVVTALVREEDGVDGVIIKGMAAEGETGMLLVRGPNVFSGYLGESPDPFVEFAGEKWYRTGDLVSRDADGRLVFRGRLKRFVKIGGEMISLPQMEAVLLEAFAGRDDIPEEGPSLAVEAGPEETRPQIALFTPMNIQAAEANAALRRAGLSPLYSITRVVQKESLPLLGSGKTDYRSLKKSLEDELFFEGALPPQTPPAGAS